MLIIGHRGAAGLAPENTLESLQAGFDVGADMLEFDVQLTRDHVPIVIHDSSLIRTHGKYRFVRWSTHEGIIAASEHGHKIATLEEVLDLFFGRVLLNLEIKSNFTALRVAKFIEKKYIHDSSDWQNILFSSFHPRELVTLRKFSQYIELAMLHDKNPYRFLSYQRSLDLAAVGFNRTHIAKLPLEVAKRLELFVYLYTVNRPDALAHLPSDYIDGVVTDNPRDIRTALSSVV